MGRYILSSVLLFLLFDCRSQQTNAIDWHRIDSLITTKKELNAVYDQLQQYRLKSLNEKKYLNAARGYYYQLLVTDLRTEDSVWFHNSAFIDSLLMTQQDNKELQWVMHVLQAKRLTGFTTKSYRFNRERYERKDIPVNYAAFSNDQLDSIAQYHFEEAKRIVRNMDTDATDAFWLSSDPLLFLFKPGLFDIVIAEQIYYLKRKHFYGFTPWDLKIKVMELSPDIFIEKLDSLYAADKEYLKQFKYYKEWLTWQRQTPMAYYFIETLARKFAHDIMSGQYDLYGEDIFDDGYEGYLQRMVSSPLSTVKAHAVYQLCLLWNLQSKKYFPSDGYRYYSRAVAFRTSDNYDTTYRYHAVKAMLLFEQHKNMLDSFGFLKNILLRVEQQILRNDVELSMDEYSLPDEPILAELSYRNAEKLYYSIVRLNNDFVFRSGTKRQSIDRLRLFPEVTGGVIDLPHTDDYNKHGTYIKLNGLSPGNYRILFSHRPVTDSNRKIESAEFKVSSIAVVSNDRKVFVLDRKTGVPLKGARVAIYYPGKIIDSSGRKLPPAKTYAVNEQGFTIVSGKKAGVTEVYYTNDTVRSIIDFRYSNDNEPDDVYDKDEYDDLAEFYEDKTTTEIFTDRIIYRPGQTVNFKAIFLTKNKNTGEREVMSKENMGSSLFRSVYKKWLKNSNPVLYVTDPFSRVLDSLKVTLNEYGSVSGSFVLPKTAATGRWEIASNFGDGGHNEGLFKVEEYKRPSYEISIEMPKKELLPADSFTVKVKVKSFAGAVLNNVLINYSVTRQGLIPDEKEGDKSGRLKTINVTEDLIDTSAFTNAEGELDIQINDSLLKKYLLTKDKVWDFTYKIEAEAVDMTGENYEANTSVTVTSRPVSISLPFAKDYDRSEKNSTLISTTDINAGKVVKEVRVKIYKLIKENKLYGTRKLMRADQWVYSKDQLQQWFPLVNFFNRQDTGTKKLVLEKTFKTGNGERLDLDPAIFSTGDYLAEAFCEEKGNLLGENKKEFSVYDEKQHKLSGARWTFYHAKANILNAGDTVKIYNGNSEMPVYAIYYITWYAGKRKTKISESYEISKQAAGLHTFKWKLPADAFNQAMVTQLYILNNEVFYREEQIYINTGATTAPEIILEQYRKKLSPGSKEIFSVSIKTKNENTAAELMTTMYDASLDKLERHKWEKPREDRNRNLSTDWEKGINSTTKSSDFSRGEYYYEMEMIKPDHPTPLWWINPLDQEHTDKNRIDASGWINLQHDMNPDIYWDEPAYAFSSRLMGRAAGLQIASTSGFDQVIVTGYATSKVSADFTTSSSVTIRGASSLTNYRQPLIILDGFPFNGDLSKLDPNTITQAIILKGVDASGIWGAQAASGVLVLSTKGDIVFPTLPPDPPLPPRRNFSETAFFFPNVYADKDGYYRFSFTMPESVTEWTWKLMAHTKKAKFAYIERKLNTQLPLMVQPNMPRLLYQGDRIVLQSRITNLDTLDANGKVLCKIEDVVTGEDLSSVWLKKVSNDFSVSKKANVSSAFEINIPKTQLNPVKIIISVRSQQFSDGEEHLLPVLSPKILVRETVPFRFSANDTVLQAASLDAEADLYGVGLSIFSKPQAALINALPWLANYSFDCAEQTFNKLLANVTALQIMRTDAEAQRSFEKAKQVVEKQTVREQLPDELSEQTMPWLAATNKTISTRRKLFELLDTSRSEQRIASYLDKLYKLQNDNGGLAWFEGGKSNGYISNYVLAGFGKLTKDNLIIPERLFDREYNEFIERLRNYCQGNFQQAQYGKTGFNDPMMYVYAASFWKKKYPVGDSLLKSIKTLLTEKWKKVNSGSLYAQSILIITTLRYFDKAVPEYQLAVQQLNSIEQLAIKDDVNGIRWKDLADNDDMSTGAEETLTLIADAFSEAGIHPQLSSGITKWLLTAKNDDHWSSTKATSAVIGMLAKENKTVTGISQSIKSTFNGKELSVSDDLLRGNEFSFVRASTQLPVTLKKEATVPAAGSLIWYYFTPGDVANKANKQINLKKELSRYNSASGKWEAINEKTILRIADKIQVVLTIETPKALRYVYIDDKRAAAFEPGENHSGYIYMDGTDYYQSIRDAGTQFFTDFIPSGRSTISYQMKVAQEGHFTSGPASLQCMYRPEISAYSNSISVQTGR